MTVCLPVAPGDTGAAGGAEEATCWDWWRCRPWLPDDLTPERTVVQVPRRLVGAYLGVKISLMRAVLEATATDADPRWKALLHIDQMLMAAPTKRHKAGGLKTQAAVLKRGIKWANQQEREALLHDAQPDEVGPMRAPPSEA